MAKTIITVVTELKKDIEYIREDLKLNREEHKDIITALENLHKKFANKWVEKVTMLIMAAMIGVIVKLVIVG